MKFSRQKQHKHHPHPIRRPTHKQQNRRKDNASRDDSSNPSPNSPKKSSVSIPAPRASSTAQTAGCIFDLLTVRGVVRPLALDPERCECMYTLVHTRMVYAWGLTCTPRLGGLPLVVLGFVVIILIWTVPNGASMRPNTTVQQRIVRAARGGVDACVYCVGAGAFTVYL